MASSCGLPTVKNSETFYLIFGSDPKYLDVGWQYIDTTGTETLPWR
jgi:hypothetical protein